MGKAIKRVFPPLGLRIIKSAVAVLLCYLISFLRGDSGYVFYSQLAALWCMQIYVRDSRKMAKQRIIGTSIGAAFGLIVILLTRRLPLITNTNKLLYALLISGMILIILYTTVLINRKQASYFSCVVFLSIVVNHVADQNPYLFVWNRFLDTLIGILIGVAVNSFHLPRHRNQDVLFISGLDDTLLNEKDNLSAYGKVELNRMLDDGIRFTISTIRTPASLMEPLHDIRLQLPVIAMDGAVLYDIREKRYLHIYVISGNRASQLYKLIHEQQLTCFVNVIIDDMLVIYYEDTQDEVYQGLVEELRRSPYRNYVKRKPPEGEEVVYFMLLAKTQQIEEFYQLLIQQEYHRELKLVMTPAKKYEGYTYLRIYNRNATKKHMIDYLKKELSMNKTVTFGSIEGQYDYLIQPGDSNTVIKRLKQLYEPCKIERRKL